MKGAILGDIVGSRYEGQIGLVPRAFQLFMLPGSRFTDDTILTAAVAEALLVDPALRGPSPAEHLRAWGWRYPHARYGAMFRTWLRDPDAPYESFGNGCVMRVSACGWLAQSEDEALRDAAWSCLPTHSHPRSIAAAKAVAAAIWRLRCGDGREVLTELAQRHLGREPVPWPAFVERTPDAIGIEEPFGTVLAAFASVIAANGFEDALRNAVHLGGDTDTVAAVAGSVAEALFGIPEDLWSRADDFLTEDIRRVVCEVEKRVETGRLGGGDRCRPRHDWES